MVKAQLETLRIEPRKRIVGTRGKSPAGGAEREDAGGSGVPTGRVRKGIKESRFSDLHRVHREFQRTAEVFKPRSRQDQMGLGKGKQVLRAVRMRGRRRHHGLGHLACLNLR